MWVALFPVAFVAAKMVDPGWTSPSPASPRLQGLHRLPHLLLWSPRAPETPKKTSQNILGIPSMSQSNIKPLFSFNNRLHFRTHW